MTDEVVISVRGEASTTVMPDAATLHCSVRTQDSSKAEALHASGVALEGFRSGLAHLGGVARTAENSDAALTWAASSANTHDEYDYDDATGKRRTGMVVASVELRLVVRDFALLTPIAELFATHERADLGRVTWQVDEDNAAWRHVRADAIATALQRARDYAAALGGSIVKVAQLADAGLLAHGDGHEQGRAVAYGRHASGEFDEGPRLDPEVQTVFATVDVRAVASVAGLGDVLRLE